MNVCLKILEAKIVVETTTKKLKWIIAILFRRIQYLNSNLRTQCSVPNQEQDLPLFEK